MALPATIKQALEKTFGDRVRFDEPMAAHTSLKIGGPADALVWPETETQLLELLRHLDAEGIAWFVIGGGTNLLVGDAGLRAVVVDLGKGFAEIAIERRDNEQAMVRAGGGARLSALCRYAVENGLAGMLFATGIPGTVGGAAVMNAGTSRGDMASVISDIRMATGPDAIETVTADRLCFSYRGLQWGDQAAQPVIVSVGLCLGEKDREVLRREQIQMQQWRKKNQPAGLSAGCFFKNPADGHPAGQLIEQAGLKGIGIGDAVVSEKHANFILNRGQATASDMRRLIETVQNRVYQTFNVYLELEVKIIGD
ncbi:MAG: UDP-N-acetylmuramate dehydrogenase [Thermodesulfobacteriota bacterium]